MNIRAQAEQWLHRQWNKRGLLSLLLRPLSAMITLYTQRKSQRPRAKLTVKPPPIIVVGNIIVGGAGKTPVVLAISDFLKKNGWQPGIISRGYGIEISGPARVGKGQLDPKQFGDEPTLLAQQSGVPIAVHPKRVLALEALCTTYPAVNVVIADDGLQHQALSRDIEVMVQDGRGVANGLVLPAGPLRETPARLTQADWLITQLAPRENLPQTPTPTDPLRCVTMRLKPSHFEQLSSGQILSAKDWLQQHQLQPCIALAGIGQPTRFFLMLKELGLILEQTIALPDHGQLSPSYFHRLNTSLVLITAKDAVKYPLLADHRIWVVHVTPQFTPHNWLVDLQQKLYAI